MSPKQQVLERHAEDCWRRAERLVDPLMRLNFLDLAAQWLELAALHQELEEERHEIDRSREGPVRKRSPAKAVRRSWRQYQRRAFEKALTGEPLETTLGVLTSAVSDTVGGTVRAAFYIANPAGTTLHHVVGMPVAYAEAVDGFKIGADSLACGLATHIGQPVLTSDVGSDPRWRPWRNMAEKFDYRGCWSFPIRIGSRMGSLAIYSSCPRGATISEVQFGEMVARSAAVVIGCQILKTGGPAC